MHGRIQLLKESLGQIGHVSKAFFDPCCEVEEESSKVRIVQEYVQNYESYLALNLLSTIITNIKKRVLARF